MAVGVLAGEGLRVVAPEPAGAGKEVSASRGTKRRGAGVLPHGAALRLRVRRLLAEHVASWRRQRAGRRRWGRGPWGRGPPTAPALPRASPPRGVPPHCEPANRRAEVGRAGRAEAAVVQLAQHSGSDGSDLGSGGSRGVSVTQKAVELPRRVDRPMPPPIALHLTGFPFPPILIGKRGGRGRPNVRVSPRSDGRCRCYTESRL